MSNCPLIINLRCSILNPFTAQWCVFNNYTIYKHRHQIWDYIVISVLKTCLEFQHSSPQKFKKWHFSNLKKNIPKVHFYFKISRPTFLLFWPFLISKVLEVVLWLLSFFSWIKIDFACQKALADIFFLKPSTTSLA